MRRLLIFFLGVGLCGLAAYAKPKTSHPLVIRRHAHVAPARKPHESDEHKAPHRDLAYTPKKPKHFKLAKP